MRLCARTASDYSKAFALIRRGDAARQRAWRGPRLPGLTGVVVGRPTAEDSIVLTPVGVPSISFAIKICERPDAGVAEDEETRIFSGAEPQRPAAKFELCRWGEKQASRSQEDCNRRDHAQCEEKVVAFSRCGNSG